MPSHSYSVHSHRLKATSRHRKKSPHSPMTRTCSTNACTAKCCRSRVSQCECNSGLPQLCSTADWVSKDCVCRELSDLQSRCEVWSGFQIASVACVWCCVKRCGGSEGDRGRVRLRWRGGAICAALARVLLLLCEVDRLAFEHVQQRLRRLEDLHVRRLGFLLGERKRW